MEKDNLHHRLSVLQQELGAQQEQLAALVDRLELLRHERAALLAALRASRRERDQRHWQLHALRRHARTAQCAAEVEVALRAVATTDRLLTMLLARWQHEDATDLEALLIDLAHSAHPLADRQLAIGQVVR